MKTGDIILFKGNGLFSALIMAAPGADYSHVGIFVEHPLHGPCVFESTSLGTLSDVIIGKPIYGVQLVPFDERIASYEGEVFHRPIIGERLLSHFETVYSFIDQYHGTPYEKDNRQLINAQLDIPIFPWQKNKADDSSLFCSETVVMCLRDAGFIIADENPPNEFTPTDCSDYIILMDGFVFGDIVAV